MHINTRKTDVAIIGGGINGPILSLALAQHGIKSIIIDAVKDDLLQDADFDGRAYSIAPSSKNLLVALGIWEDIKNGAAEILDILVSDGKVSTGASPLFMHFDHKYLNKGPISHMVEDQKLRLILREKIHSNHHITILSPNKVSSVKTHIGHTELNLENGDIIQAKLAVACDGANSMTAKNAGIKKITWPYHQTAIVCTVKHQKPHQNVAHEYFLPSGPFAILPLKNNMSSIVWTEKTTIAQNILKLDDESFYIEFTKRFGEFLGEISLTGPRYNYPLTLSLATEYVKPRLALIGDAAHRVHPIAGQGLNMGLKDIAALTEVLIDNARLGADIGDINVLKKYESWRKFDSTVLSLGMDALNKIFSNDNTSLRISRDMGLHTISNTPALVKLFMHIASGNAGNVPKLLQGKPI